MARKNESAPQDTPPERRPAIVQQSSHIEHASSLTLSELRSLVQDTAGWDGDSRVHVRYTERPGLLGSSTAFHRITVTAKRND